MKKRLSITLSVVLLLSLTSKRFVKGFPPEKHTF